MYRLVRFFLFLLPPELAHRLAMTGLELVSRFEAFCRFLRDRAIRRVSPVLATSFAGIKVIHPLGLAAGLDKDALTVPAFFALGFAAVEVGTLTPKAQPGNPTPRLFRIPEHRALINRMGFNNHGALAASKHLKSMSEKWGPLGINIGKNKSTLLENAAEDYLQCVDLLALSADYLVLNASSPNTPQLRELQEPAQLKGLLQTVRGRLDEIKASCPLFLKIAPDLSPEALDDLVDVALECKIQGIVATNTTVERPFKHRHADQAGGMSGGPLTDRSTETIRRIWCRAGGQLSIIGVGGVFSAEDAYEKLCAGASFVQIYTGLVYEGPGLISTLLEGLLTLIRRDGFATLHQAIGSRARVSTKTET